MLTKAFFIVRRRSTAPPNARRLLASAAKSGGISGGARLGTVTTRKISYRGCEFYSILRSLVLASRVLQRGCACERRAPREGELRRGLQPITWN